MRKHYTIRKNGEYGLVWVNWKPLRPEHVALKAFGNEARYVMLGFTDKSYKNYYRNPYGKPLLSKGRAWRK